MSSVSPEPLPPVRWIGFDMDECVGNVMPLAAFAYNLGPDAVGQHLADSECEGRTWLLRPGFPIIIEMVAAAFAEKQIVGAFLYSNNSQSSLVECVCAILNTIAERRYGVRPFLAGFHRSAAARDNNKVKSYSDICNCLHVKDLPLPSTAEDLLFFDDMEHVLTSEIKYYVKVPKYDGRVSVITVAAALESLKTAVGDDFFTQIVILALEKEAERKDVEVPAGEPCIEAFVEGLAQFLGIGIRR